jgi:DNA mismatch endonuclease (patch repair protein)
MRHIRSKDSKPEIRVRQFLHALGYRFRLHRRELPGNPDIVLPRHRLVIFVHGCFWHQHPGCRHARIPRTREEYWLPKLTRTQERDEENRLKLEALGWRTLTIWECNTTDHDALQTILKEKLA